MELEGELRPVNYSLTWMVSKWWVVPTKGGRSRPTALWGSTAILRFLFGINSRRWLSGLKGLIITATPSHQPRLITTHGAKLGLQEDRRIPYGKPYEKAPFVITSKYHRRIGIRGFLHSLSYGFLFSHEKTLKRITCGHDADKMIWNDLNATWHTMSTDI